MVEYEFNQDGTQGELCLTATGACETTAHMGYCCVRKLSTRVPSRRFAGGHAGHPCTPLPIRRLLAQALVIATLLAFWQPAGAQTSAERKKAKGHFSVGIEMLDATPPNYQGALLQFQQAYELSKSWKVLGNLGLCALQLERDGEAVKHFNRYLKQGGSNISAAERSDIERDLLTIQAGLATVDLGTDVPTAKIIVTRKGSGVPSQVYVLQQQRARLGLRAGTYRIVAKVGSKELAWSVVLGAKETETHRYTFKARTAKAAAPATHNAPTAGAALGAGRSLTPAEDSSVDNPSVLGTVGYVVAGAGVAALGTGAFFGLQANKEDEDARMRLETLCPNNACPSNARSEFDQRDSNRDTANLLYIGGGVLAAAGLVMILVDASADEAAPREGIASLRVTPSFSPQQLGLRLGGSF